MRTFTTLGLFLASIMFGISASIRVQDGRLGSAVLCLIACLGFAFAGMLRRRGVK